MGKTPSLFQLSSIHCSNFDISIPFKLIAEYDKDKHGGKNYIQVFFGHTLNLFNFG